jgi:hypothetical protein
VKLTDAICKTLVPPPKGNRVYYESHGFGLRVTANGARSFVLILPNARGPSPTVHDRQLGCMGRSGGTGRDLRRRIDQGADPLGELKDERNAETLADLTERFRSDT